MLATEAHLSVDAGTDVKSLGAGCRARHEGKRYQRGGVPPKSRKLGSRLRSTSGIAPELTGFHDPIPARAGLGLPDHRGGDIGGPVGPVLAEQRPDGPHRDQTDALARAALV